MEIQYCIPVMDYSVDQTELTESETALYREDEIYELLLSIAERLYIDTDWLTPSAVETGFAYVKEFDPFALPAFYKNRRNK